MARADLGWATDARDAAPEQRDTERDFLDMAKPIEWEACKSAQDAAASYVKINDLFIQYTLK